MYQTKTVEMCDKRMEKLWAGWQVYLLNIQAIVTENFWTVLLALEKAYFAQ